MYVYDWLHAFSTQFLKYINNTPIKITSLQNTRLVLFIVDCLVTPLPVAIGSPITPVGTTDPYHPGRPLIFKCWPPVCDTIRREKVGRPSLFSGRHIVEFFVPFSSNCLRSKLSKPTFIQKYPSLYSSQFSIFVHTFPSLLYDVNLFLLFVILHCLVNCQFFRNLAYTELNSHPLRKMLSTNSIIICCINTCSHIYHAISCNHPQHVIKKLVLSRT